MSTKYFSTDPHPKVAKISGVSLLQAGNVTLFTPPDQDIRFIPTSIIIDNVTIKGTLTVAPIVRVDQGTDGSDIVGATTLTSAAANRCWMLRPIDGGTGQSYVITGGLSLRLRKATLGVGQATTFRARTNGIVTLTTAAAHGFVAGDTIVVASVGGTGYNGTITVLRVPSTTTFQYAASGADEASTADAAGRVGNYLADITVIGV